MWAKKSKRQSASRARSRSIGVEQPDILGKSATRHAGASRRQPQQSSFSRLIDRLQHMALDFIGPILGLIVVGMLLLVAAHYWQLYRRHILPIKQVQVMSVLQHTDKQQLQQVLHALPPQHMFAAALPRLSQQLLTDLPWVRAVRWRLLWPSTLQLYLQEYQPQAVWKKHAFMDADGKIFSVGAVAPASATLPELSGPAGSSSVVWQQYHRFQQILEPLQLKLRALRLSEDGQWLLTLQNGSQIYSGALQAAQRLTRFAKLYKKLNKAHKGTISRFDLRYPNAVAVH